MLVHFQKTSKQMFSTYPITLYIFFLLWGESPKVSIHLLQPLCHLLGRTDCDAASQKVGPSLHSTRTWAIHCINSLKGFYLSVFLFAYKTVKLLIIHTCCKMWACCDCGFTLTSHLVLRKMWDQVDRQENTGADIAAAFSQSPDVCTVTLQPTILKAICVFDGRI